MMYDSRGGKAKVRTLASQFATWHQSSCVTSAVRKGPASERLFMPKQTCFASQKRSFRAQMNLHADLRVSGEGLYEEDTNFLCAGWPGKAHEYSCAAP